MDRFWRRYFVHAILYVQPQVDMAFMSRQQPHPQVLNSQFFNVAHTLKHAWAKACNIEKLGRAWGRGQHSVYTEFSQFNFTCLPIHALRHQLVHVYGQNEQSYSLDNCFAGKRCFPAIKLTWQSPDAIYWQSRQLAFNCCFSCRTHGNKFN